MVQEVEAWRILRKGDTVRLRRIGDTGEFSPGTVDIAFPVNGTRQSIMVLLSAPVRGLAGVFVSGIPLTIDYDAGTVEGFDHQQYDLEVIVMPIEPKVSASGISG